MSCGKTLGHGISCVDGYLCNECTEIERLIDLVEILETKLETVNTEYILLQTQYTEHLKNLEKLLKQ